MITQEQANEAAQIIIEFMKQEAKIHPKMTSTEPDHWCLAALWCNDILDASERDGWNGCQLCRN